MNTSLENHPHGAGPWARLRLAAVALIPLSFWMVYSVIELRNATYDDFTLWLKNPYNMTMLVVFILLSFYHGALGTQEIIEDYVHGKCQKPFILLKKFSLFVLAVVSILSIVKVAF